MTIRRDGFQAYAKAHKQNITAQGCDGSNLTKSKIMTVGELTETLIALYHAIVIQKQFPANAPVSVKMKFKKLVSTLQEHCTEYMAGDTATELDRASSVGADERDYGMDGNEGVQ